MSNGFKLSADLLKHLNTKDPAYVKTIADSVLPAVQELIGAHVKHNTYFKEFPNNIPDTTEFWVECINDALQNIHSRDLVARELESGFVNLLDLPKYGRYQHSYEAMVAAHEALTPLISDKLKVLKLGAELSIETNQLYQSIASSAIPVNDSDKALLRDLAEICVDNTQPVFTVRENKAIVNAIRLKYSKALLVDTVTDILRVACELSGGDVSLKEKTKFKSFKRAYRRNILEALNSIESPLADINQYAEVWKRLGERLHPNEYPEYSKAISAFKVSHGEEKALSLRGTAEKAFIAEDYKSAIKTLSQAPGFLYRNIDHIARGLPFTDHKVLLTALTQTAPYVSTRVLLSVREHLQNRHSVDSARIFANTKGTAYVTEDKRTLMNEKLLTGILAVIDSEVDRRIPVFDSLSYDKDILSIAIPMSDKIKPHGFGVLPRGSITRISGESVRFFVYWKQHHTRTDYDLSSIHFADDFSLHGQVSWTNLRDGNMVHSGDITDAPNGATEFIDAKLSTIHGGYLVPQVNVFSGESYDEVEAGFFGFMERALAQKGLPFEPRTVKFKADLAGKNKIALPLIFARDKDGWYAKWMHLNLKGLRFANMVEKNHVTTSLLVKAIIDKKFLTMDYLIAKMESKAKSVTVFTGSEKLYNTVYFGLTRPEALDKNSQSYTTLNLAEVIGLLDKAKKV